MTTTTKAKSRKAEKAPKPKEPEAPAAGPDDAAQQQLKEPEAPAAGADDAAQQQPKEPEAPKAPAEPADETRKMALRARIREALSEHPGLRVSDLASRLGLEQEVVRTTLYAMRGVFQVRPMRYPGGRPRNMTSEERWELVGG